MIQDESVLRWGGRALYHGYLDTERSLTNGIAPLFDALYNACADDAIKGYSRDARMAYTGDKASIVPAGCRTVCQRLSASDTWITPYYWLTSGERVQGDCASAALLGAAHWRGRPLYCPAYPSEGAKESHVLTLYKEDTAVDLALRAGMRGSPLGRRCFRRNLVTGGLVWGKLAVETQRGAPPHTFRVLWEG